MSEVSEKVKKIIAEIRSRIDTNSPRHADPRLLAIPASCSRVPDCNSDYERLSRISSSSRFGNRLYLPL